MPQTTQRREDDERILAILCVMESESTKAARERFGLSNGAVQSYRARYLKPVDATPCACTKPENRDGGMIRRWWNDRVILAELRGA